MKGLEGELTASEQLLSMKKQELYIMDSMNETQEENGKFFFFNKF